MRRPLLIVLAAAALACSGASTPTDTPADGACGPLGGACSSEGTMCSPEPIGDGWGHMLQCSGGAWTEVEVAPMP